MPEMENIILSVVFFLVMCAIFYFWKLKKKKEKNSARKSFVLDCLEQAKAQYEIFNIKSNIEGEAKNGISAMLEKIDKNTLQMESSNFIPQDWQGKDADVFFRVKREEGPVFYAFKTVIRRIRSDYEHSEIEVSLPDHIRVEKNRHFVRVQPQKDDVQVIGVWPIKPGSRLPHSSADIGKPISQYRKGRTDAIVKVENVSASGIALRFKLDKQGNPPLAFSKGSQLICLVVYQMDDQDEKPTAFWCSGEIMNSRIAEGQERELVLGLEYTNWAILEQGTSEIHWAHSSPTRGARPILQWVKKIEQRQSEKANKLTA